MKLGISIRRASALLCTAAAVFIVTSPTRAQTNPTIRVSALSIESAAEVYYAKDMGFFAKAGLDVDIQSLPGGSAAIGAAIAGGTIDIGYSAIDTLASLHAKGIPVIVIAPANEYLSPGSLHTTAMVVPVTSSVQNAKDLKGKTVAVGALNSVAEIAPAVWIDKNGGDSSTVKFVEVPFGAMPAAIQAARIDAAWIAEPFIGVATRNGRAMGYGFDGISKHFLVSSWFTTPQWATDHADLVKRFAAVMHETAVWANANPPQSGEILAKYTKIDPTVISTMARTHFGEQLAQL